MCFLTNRASQLSFHDNWPDIRPDIRYPAGYPVPVTGYPAGYRIAKKAGYPA